MSKKQRLWSIMALAGMIPVFHSSDVNTGKVKEMPKTQLNKKQKKARAKAKVAKQSRKMNRR